jgi:hypothetical protein
MSVRVDALFDIRLLMALMSVKPEPSQTRAPSVRRLHLLKSHSSFNHASHVYVTLVSVRFISKGRQI